MLKTFRTTLGDLHGDLFIVLERNDVAIRFGIVRGESVKRGSIAIEGRSVDIAQQLHREIYPDNPDKLAEIELLNVIELLMD